MSKSLPEKVSESYLLFRDDEGWKLLHPERGPCLVVAEQEMGIATALSFEKMVIGDTYNGLTILSDIDEDLETAKEQLIMDGYNKRDIKKMKLRHANTVCFSY
jgi:hypothetical protein